MICPPCRGDRHEDCPEEARRRDGTLTPVELAANSRCDCQHQERRQEA